MEMTYLGTNTLIFKKDGAALMVDPHFSRPGLLQLLWGLRSDPLRVAQGLGLAGVRELDAVLLTHTHYDHALDLPAVIREVGGTVYGSGSTRQILLGSGLPGEFFHPVKHGKAYRIHSFTVRFHPARHISFPTPLRWLMPEMGRITTPLKPPKPFWAYRCGGVYAVQVDRVLIFGSAGFEPGAYDGLDVEDVILGIGGLETRPAAYLRQLYTETMLASGADRLWLSHWDNFFRPLKRGLSHLALSRWTVKRLKALGEEHGQLVTELPFNQMIYM